ncbi:MAG: hypothetical protein MHMPM18_003427, partial [Marteilia pararefringens]
MSILNEVAKTINIQVVENCERIDYNEISQQKSILFFKNIVLYEDDLGDFGIVIYSVKIRCMESYFFILARCVYRVDGVEIRYHDTRIYGK